MNLIHVILAAGPAVASQAQAPASTQPSDPLNALYILVGSQVVISVIGLVVGFVKWMGSRTVQREDQDKEELKKLIKAHDEKFEAIEKKYQEKFEALEKRYQEKFEALEGAYDEKVEELEGSLTSTDKAMSSIQNELKQSVSTLEGTRATINEIRMGMDNRFEKQGEFYRTSLKALETQMRQDMTRSIHDALQMEKMKAVQEREAREYEQPRTRRSKPG